jgi:hypothetical protein
MIGSIIAALAAPVLGTLGYLGAEYVIESDQKTMHQWRHPEYYEGEFPQEAFPCRPEHQQKYHELVTQGYARMSQKTVVITGLARNIAHNFEKMKKRIETTGNFFKEYVVLIFENDSHDGTRKLLEDWAATNPRIKLLSVPGAQDGKLNIPNLHSYGATSKKRIEKMSYFRNIYMAEVHRNYTHFDYMLTIDMDLKGPWNNDGLAHTIAHDTWDGVASLGLLNQFGTAGFKLIMYDVLAYLTYQEEFKLEVDGDDIYNMSVRYNKEIGDSKKGDAMIRVRSAFGGMAIYKIPSLKNCWYKPIRCEHIGLHEQMAAHGHKHIFMNPNQLILAGHQGNLNTLAQFKEYYKQKTAA